MLVAVTTIAPPAGARPPSCPGCNVVLVSFDALRADRLGTYGNAKPTSPALDALARHSTVFERCLSQSATTVTAVPAMLTGRFPIADRLLDKLTLRASEDTLATVLGRAGYRTLAVISHTFAGCKYSGCRGIDVASDAPPRPESAAATAERTLRLLRAETRTPFFLWVHVRLPHAPYDATADEFRRMYDGGEPTFFSPGIPPRDFFRALGALVARSRTRGEPVTPMDVVNGSRRDTTPSVVAQMRALYDANVRLGDDAFGRIVAHLKRRGTMSRTVIVVAADHGEALGEHAVIGHNGLSFAMLHTPLIVRVPGRRGRRSTAPVMNVDVLPTIAKIVGVPLHAPVRGRDAFEPRDPRALQYAEYVNRYTVIRWPDKADANTFTIKVLKTDDPSGARMVDKTTTVVHALWDVEHDPAETMNRAKERPEVGAELTALREASLAPQLVTEPRPPAEEVFDRLKALGYVERDPASGD